MQGGRGQQDLEEVKASAAQHIRDPDERMNKTFHYSKTLHKDTKDRSSIGGGLSQVLEEDASDRDKRMKSVRLVDSFGMIEKGKMLLDQGRR